MEEANSDKQGVDSYLDLRQTDKNGPVIHILRSENGEMFVLGPELGQGAVARVISARDLNTGEAVAIKVIEKGFQDSCALSNEDRAMQEIRCLESISHPNIVRYISHHRTADSIFIVQELINGISLLEYLTHKGNRINMEAALHIFCQAVSAVKFMHSVGVYHRDLKLENMILDIHGVMQIIDFDLAHKEEHGDEGKLLDMFCGTPHIACPEIWRAEPYSGSKADIWSLGVIFYVLLTGAYPYDGDYLEELRDDILTGELEIPKDVPGPIKSLLNGLLNRSPKERMTIDDLASHPIITAAEGRRAKRGTHRNSPIPRSSSSKSSENLDEKRRSSYVSHGWRAPVIDGKQAAELRRHLLDTTKSSNSDSTGETKDGMLTPVSYLSQGSSLPASPDRKSIIQALDDLLDDDASQVDARPELQNQEGNQHIESTKKKRSGGFADIGMEQKQPKRQRLLDTSSS
ncbi:hypothetical protein AAMO2058_000099600 [Amorphochlora amoebiformis]